MTSTPRRPGFRLPWSAESADAAEAAESQTDAAATTPTLSADAWGAVGDDTPTVPSSPAGEATSAPTVAAAAPSVSPSLVPVASEPPSPFLRSLVDAMRGVAEEARDANLAELKTLVEKRVEQIDARTQERAEDLRRRSELDIKGVGDWERGEVERIRSEAERKVEARRQQLEQQLSDQEQQTAREIAAMRTRLADHERELAAFFARLTQIDDPAEFVSIAKLIPQAPSLDAEAGAPAALPPPEAVPGQALDERLAQLGIDNGKEPSPAAASNGTSAAVPSGDLTLTERLAQLEAQQPKDDQAAGDAPLAAGAEVSSAVVVKGLASFGAITSFKQALEKVEGIHGVTLSLGPSGEFVYRASHDAGFDLDAAIVALESGAASVEHEPDGTLRVTISRPR